MAFIRVLLLLSILALTQGRELVTESDSISFEKPWFCHDLDCPKYKVLNKADKYEIREYESATWAVTTVSSVAYTLGVTEGFKRLFDYISGKNEGEKKLEMTSPVATRTQPGQGPFCKSNFTTAFYVPPKYQKDPPKPTNPDVLITRAPKGRTAVLQFGGFIAEYYTVAHKIKELEEALDADNVSYNPDMIFSASYDPPFRLQHRHNEIQIALSEETDDAPIVTAQ